MNTLTLLCFLGLAYIVAGQNTGNDELLQAINAALHSWQTSGSAASSWFTWFGYEYDAPTCAEVSYPANPTSGGTLAAVINRGNLRIGSDYPSPPLYFNDDAGNPQGFDVDFANFLTTQLSTQYGTTITSSRISTLFGDLLTDLDDPSYPYDVVSGGMFVTAARQAQANFACNISIGGLSGLVLSTNEGTYTTINNIATAGVVVGALNASVQYTYAQSQGATVVSVASADVAWPLLQNGTIDAWIGSKPTISYWLSVNPTAADQLYQIPQWGEIDGVAWAVRKDTGSSSDGHRTVVAGVVATTIVVVALLL